LVGVGVGVGIFDTNIHWVLPQAPKLSICM
jgi:hypothetical protein